MSHSVSENEQSATFRQDVRMARKGTQSPLLLANAIAGRYGRLPQVEAVALAGSQASGTADPGSDVDLLVEIALKQCKQVPAGMMQQVSELIASTQTTHWGHAQTPHPIWVGYSSEIWGTGHSLIPRSGVPNLLGSFARNPNKFGTPILASPKLLTCTQAASHS